MNSKYFFYNYYIFLLTNIKKIIKDVKKAAEYAEEIAEKNDLILVTGSCFVVGEAIRKSIKKYH